MSKFNRDSRPLPAVARASSPLATVVSPQLSSALVVPDTATHEGGDGFARTPRTELFLACTAGFITENAFYETGDQRIQRVVDLTHEVVLETDGLAWLLDFVTWMRGPEGNIRAATIVVAAETLRGVHLAREAGRPFVTLRISGAGSVEGGPETLRRIIGAALQRADEPGEMLAYWTSRYGRPLPNSLRRGIADAAARLYNEYSTLKYDTSKASVRFGDVVALCRPQPAADKAVLFRHLIERRHPDWKDSGGQELGKRGVSPELPMMQARARLEATPVGERRWWLSPRGNTERLTVALRQAGATWEYLSGWLSDGKGMDAAAWEAIIPQMGYMALLRNLRNFDEAGVSDEVAESVAATIASKSEVERSRQLPFRFLSAYEAAPSDRWKVALGKALGHAMGNLPELNMSTLVMVDTSGSMQKSVSDNSGRQMVDVAALFGVALTYRNIGKVGLYIFGDRAAKHEVTRGGSVLAEVAKIRARIGEVGHGTQIRDSTMAAFGTGYHRVILLSDMQGFGDGPSRHHLEAAYRRDVAHLSELIPARVPIYAFDLSGYAAGVIPAGGAARFQLGGLSDATFRMIPQVESGRTGNWPWEK